MIEKVLDSDGATFGGIMTLSGTVLINIYEIITMENINNLLEFALAVGGGLFLWYKIQGQKLDNRKKRRDLEE